MKLSRLLRSLRSAFKRSPRFDLRFESRRNRSKSAFLRKLTLEGLETRRVMAFSIYSHPSWWIGARSIYMYGSGDADSVVISVSPEGYLQHDLPLSDNLVSSIDLDSTAPGEQSSMADKISYFNIDALGGDDFIDCSAWAGGLFGSGVTIYAQEGNDVLRGSIGSDFLYGGLGSDILDGSLGDDVLYGLSDTYDPYYYPWNPGGIGIDQFYGGVGWDQVYDYYRNQVAISDWSYLADGIESFDPQIEQYYIYGGPENDTLDASLLSNASVVMSGGLGSDVLKGGSQNDTFLMTNFGADDRDSVYGGWGDWDQVEFRDTSRLKLLDSGYEVDGVLYPILDIEQFSISGTVSDDILDASELSYANVAFRGLGGNDILRGGGGNDTFDARDGNLVISGGGGNDYFFVSEASIAELSGGAGFDFLQVSNVAINLGAHGQQIISGIDGISLNAYWYNTEYNSLNLDPSFVVGASDSIDGPIVYARTGSEIIKDSSWSTVGSELINGQVFKIMKNGAASVRIQQATDVSLEFGTPQIVATYFYNFDINRPNEISGGTIRPVGGFQGLGSQGLAFNNKLLVSSSDISLSLSNIPEHDSIDVGFNLALINNWDGMYRNVEGSGDYFSVAIYGDRYFNFLRSFSDSDLSQQTYRPPTGGLLSIGSDLGFGAGNDSAYDMSLEPLLKGISHTNSSMQLLFQMRGEYWDDTNPASFGIDNLSIRLLKKPSGVAKDLPANQFVAKLKTVDIDPDATFNYSLVNGAGDADNQYFSISGDELRTAMPLNPTRSSYSVRVRATDAAGIPYDKVLTIQGLEVSNQPPTDISLSSTSIAENAAANTNVGSLSTNDPDAANSFTYTLVTGTGDADNAAFDISGNSLRAKNGFNFEAKSSYSVRIRSTDQGGLFTEKVFTINVTDVNETPTDINLSSTSIAENAAANTNVGSLSTNDPDAANSFTYTLVTGTGDADNAAFDISGNSLVAKNGFNFEAKSSYSVRIRSTDQGGLFTEKAFTINVTDVNEFAVSNPIDANSAPNLVASTAPLGTIVGITAQAFDLDGSNNTVTYSLDTSSNGRFAIHANTGVVTTAASMLNIESETLSITVRATSSDGSTSTRAFDIRVQTVVDVLGTDNADQFIATHLGGNQWSVSLNGNTVFNGTVFSSGMLRIDGRQGADGLQINGTSGADSFVVLDDRTNLNGLDIFQVQVENRSVWGLGADDTFRLQSPLQGAYGGAGRDRFMLPDSSVLVGTLDAGADYDTLDYSLRTGPITYTVGSTSSVGVTQMSGIESIIGSQALDTLIGQNQLTDWGIYGADLVQINLVDYSSFENLQGGTNVDRFQLWNGSARVSGTVHGGTGADRLTAFNLANTWQLSGSKSGSIQGLVTFSDIEALFGGSAEDRFNVQLGSAFSSIDGAGGQDECNFGSYNSAVSVSLATSSMTALGLFSSIETIVGSNQTDSITAGNGSNAWTITGSGAGQLGSIQFTSFEIARGGSGADTFQIQSGGIPIIFGGLGTDTIIGPNQTNSWRLSAAAAGVLNSTTTFREMENVTGGRGDDTVEVTSSGTLSGTLSGGEGVNTLTYQSLPSNRVAEINVLANRSTGISNLASNFQVLIGGAGNDKLIAFAGVATVLVGNAGDDELTGSTARDILIGGVGADKLWGGGGEDILIAGSSSHDANAVPLIAIRNEWNSSRTYNERIGNIRGNAINGTPLNDSYYLRGGSGGSLQGDSSIDTLFGQADQDWFIAESNDLLSDRLANELLQNPLSN